MSKKEIILVAFGTTDPEGVKGVLNIYEQSKRFGVDVNLSFTADFIRRRWNRLRNTEEQQKLMSEYQLPQELFEVKGVLHQIGECYDRGVYELIIQPLHIFHGEEYEGIISLLHQISGVKDKNSHKRKFRIGTPLLGANLHKKTYREEINTVVESLKSDVSFARENDACLVYIGHGNENYSTGAYIETEYLMRKRYGEMVFFANVEGFPFFEELPERIRKDGFKKAVLKPFMLVAGDHAKNDIFGSEDSVMNILQSADIKVIPVCSGLGEMKSIADIFLNKIEELLNEE